MARSSHSTEVPGGPTWRIWDLNPGLISFSFRATKCPLGEGWEMQHFIKKGFTRASNFPLLLPLPLTLEASLPSTLQNPGLPTSDSRKASWSQPPSSICPPPFLVCPLSWKHPIFVPSVETHSKGWGRFLCRLN